MRLFDPPADPFGSEKVCRICDTPLEYNELTREYECTVDHDALRKETTPMSSVFTCPVCDNARSSNGRPFDHLALAQHIRDTHERTAALKCAQCGRTRSRASGKLFTEATLKQHEDAHFREYNRQEAEQAKVSFQTTF